MAATKPRSSGVTEMLLGLALTGKAKSKVKKDKGPEIPDSMPKRPPSAMILFAKATPGWACIYYCLLIIIYIYKCFHCNCEVLAAWQPRQRLGKSSTLRQEAVELNLLCCKEQQKYNDQAEEKRKEQPALSE